MTWEKFKAMPFRKKAEHIWEYYRWHIVIAAVVLIFAGSWIMGIVTEKEPVMQVLMVNAYGASSGGEAFEPFLEENGISYYDDAIILNKNIQMNGVDQTNTLMAAQMLLCSLSAGEPDLIFWDTNQLIPILDGGNLTDLREILPAEVLETYQDALVYGTYDDSGERYPCGIYLEKNPWMMEHMFYVNATLSVPFCCKNRELAGSFLQYVLSYEN